jgi:uncharacterized integral membrane protein
MADEQQGSPLPRDRKEQARLIGAVIVVALIVALGIDNREEVKIGYLIGDAEVRLIWLLLITAILGAVASRLVAWRRKR